MASWFPRKVLSLLEIGKLTHPNAGILDSSNFSCSLRDVIFSPKPWEEVFKFKARPASIESRRFVMASSLFFMSGAILSLRWGSPIIQLKAACSSLKAFVKLTISWKDHEISVKVD
jgi:hypothetical protein